MLKKPIITLIVLALLISISSVSIKSAVCWSNNGYSSDPQNPKYGTHDWIAQHPLDYLPSQEKQYITDNLASYLYGTELPDNSQASDGIGDTGKHHVYFYANGALQEDDAAQRAAQEYQVALNYLKSKDYADAAKTAGIMSHYIADVAVFGHVMGSNTAWGTETHHSDYETYVNSKTESYDSSFSGYLHYDGSLITLSAYNATRNVAYDTTFGGSSGLSCVWMDTNYDWANPVFINRTGESINLAVNAIADVLHTLYVESGVAGDNQNVSQIVVSLYIAAAVIGVVSVIGLVFAQRNRKIR